MGREENCDSGPRLIGFPRREASFYLGGMSTAKGEADCGWMVIVGIPTPDSLSPYADVRDKYSAVEPSNVRHERPISTRFPGW